jgi:hypothetical protein
MQTFAPKNNPSFFNQILDESLKLISFFGGDKLEAMDLQIFHETDIYPSSYISLYLSLFRKHTHGLNSS